MTTVEQEALQELKRRVRADWPSARLRLFGSKVVGTADEESDMDVLILIPRSVDDAIRRRIISAIFEINLAHTTNISALIVSKEEWEHSPVTVLPIHAFIEKESVAL